MCAAAASASDPGDADLHPDILKAILATRVHEGEEHSEVLTGVDLAEGGVEVDHGVTG